MHTHTTTSVTRAGSLLRCALFVCSGFAAITLTVLLFSGCPLMFTDHREKVERTDPRVQLMFQAMAVSERTALGFSPVPLKAELHLIGAGKNYDDRLECYVKYHTARSVYFRKTKRGYRWTGEQELIEGPKTYTNDDGTFNEHVIITYEKEDIFGTPLNRLDVDFWGEDPRYKNRHDLTIADVQKLRKEWKR